MSIFLLSVKLPFHAWKRTTRMNKFASLRDTDSPGQRLAGHDRVTLFLHGRRVEARVDFDLWRRRRIRQGSYAAMYASTLLFYVHFA